MVIAVETETSTDRGFVVREICIRYISMSELHKTEPVISIRAVSLLGKLIAFTRGEDKRRLALRVNFIQHSNLSAWTCFELDRGRLA